MKNQRHIRFVHLERAGDTIVLIVSRHSEGKQQHRKLITICLPFGIFLVSVCRVCAVPFCQYTILCLYEFKSQSVKTMTCVCRGNQNSIVCVQFEVRRTAMRAFNAHSLLARNRKSACWLYILILCSCFILRVSSDPRPESTQTPNH